MGSILGGTIHSDHIDQLIRPMRDIFGAVFFVTTGMLLNVKDALLNWKMVVLCIFLTIFGKVLSVFFGARVSGQSFATSVQMGFAMAQIGEFSFMIASLGLGLGIMHPSLYPIAVSVSLITTLTTPYLIQASLRLFARDKQKKNPRRAA